MWLSPYCWFGVTGLLALGSGLVLRACKKRVSTSFSLRILGYILTALSAASLLPGIYLWQWQREHGAARDVLLYHGVRYVRTIQKQPRRVVCHVVFVNLRAPGISFVVTPPNRENDSRVSAATVGKFLSNTGAQVAINANFFQPFHSHSPWDYYPREGDAVEVLGIAASLGNMYSTHTWAGATLRISKSNVVTLGISPQVWNAVSGDQWLVREGAVVAQPDTFGAYPRSAVGISQDRNTLLLAVVDGKQRGFSEGLTLPEFANMLQTQGAYHAINLDGGGSATLVTAKAGGVPVELNSPIHTRIPGRQRPVAVHLGVRANALISHADKR